MKLKIGYVSVQGSRRPIVIRTRGATGRSRISYSISCPSYIITFTVVPIDVMVDNHGAPLLSRISRKYSFQIIEAKKLRDRLTRVFLGVQSQSITPGSRTDKLLAKLFAETRRAVFGTEANLRLRF